MSDSAGCTGLVDVTVVHRDGTVALDAVTVLAQPGELLAVLGPSGSGKSTVLRAIAGLTKIASGEVLITGERTSAAPALRDVAMVFENTQLMPMLDVARNMGFGLEARHVPPAEIQRRVQNESRRMRVNRLLRRRPTELSAGEQGQVGIGRALVRTPKVFLLDEPLAHVDVHERIRLRRVIAETVKASRVSALYVTHDQTDALAIGDRIAVLNAGRVAQTGSARELYDRPADLFVAEFVGTAPLGVLPAKVVTATGVFGFQVGARTLPIWGPPPDALAGHGGREVMIGLRAEDVRDAGRDPDPDWACLVGPVRAVERTGRDAFVTVQIGGGHAGGLRSVSDRLVARFDGRTTVKVGELVTVAVDASRAHVFDPGTGRALHHPS